MESSVNKPKNTKCDKMDIETGLPRAGKSQGKYFIQCRDKSGNFFIRSESF